MTKQEFYDELNTAITVGCSLPFSVPEKAIDNLVKYSAQWFHRNWDDGVENIYLSIPASVWGTNEEFKQTRKLTLPNCIYSVNAVAKDNTSKRQMGGGSADFSFDKYMTSNFGINGSFGGLEDVTQTDAVLGYVIASSWGDLTDLILNYPISYTYSRQSNKLFLKGSLIILAPLYFHHHETIQIFEILEVKLNQYNSSLIIILISLSLISNFFINKNILLSLLDSFTVIILNINFEPLLAFTVYFCFLHSIRHSLSLIQDINNRNLKKGLISFFKKALPLTIITAFGFLIAVFLLNEYYLLDSAILKVVFIGLASLTFPHILLEYLLEKNEK